VTHPAPAAPDGATDDPAPYFEVFDEAPSPEVRDTIAGFLNLCFARSLLEETIDRRLRAGSGVTLAQHEVLYRLSLSPGGRLRMADLAGLLLSSKSGASRLVDRMAAAGMVEREACATDRRLVYAVLTPTGRATLRRSGPLFVDQVVAVFGVHLDADEHRALQGVLKKLLAAHGEWDVRRCEPPPLPMRSDRQGAE
jgi:DNA-binding MarR family transcriptional regulator